MSELEFHEDETGLATLHDLSAFEYFDGHPNSETGALAMTGVWSPIRDNTGLGALAITPAELDRVVPADLRRIDNVFSFYGASKASSLLRASAFAAGDRQAIVAGFSPRSMVESIWILHDVGDPLWCRATLMALAERWQLLLWDDKRDFQCPLSHARNVDAWLEAVGRDG